MKTPNWFIPKAAHPWWFCITWGVLDALESLIYALTLGHIYPSWGWNLTTWQVEREYQFAKRMRS